jgi:hypothetical protein
MGIQDLEAKVQRASSQFFLRALQVVTAAYSSLVASHLLYKVFNFGLLSYTFCFLFFGGPFYLYTKGWTFFTLSVFNIILTLSLLVLQSY